MVSWKNKGPVIRRGLTVHHTPIYSLCNGTICRVLEFSSLHIVSAHAQVLFHKGEILLILWLWKEILAKHRFPVLSVATIFEDLSVVVSRASISRTFSSVSTILFDCFFMSHWIFGPPLFHKLGYTRLCGNWGVRIFTTKLTDTFSVSFFIAKVSTINTLFGTILLFTLYLPRLISWDWTSPYELCALFVYSLLVTP
jgi:hypothetical protein